MAKRKNTAEAALAAAEKKRIAAEMKALARERDYWAPRRSSPGPWSWYGFGASCTFERNQTMSDEKRKGLLEWLREKLSGIGTAEVIQVPAPPPPAAPPVPKTPSGLIKAALEQAAGDAFTVIPLGQVLLPQGPCECELCRVARGHAREAGDPAGV